MGSRNKVGGWTNPFEKCARQIGFILQNDQVKIQNIWNPKMVWSRWEHPFPRGPYSHVPADNLPIYDSKNAVLNASKRKHKHHLVYDSLKLTVRTYKPSAIPKKKERIIFQPTNPSFFRCGWRSFIFISLRLLAETTAPEGQITTWAGENSKIITIGPRGLKRWLKW